MIRYSLLLCFGWQLHQNSFFFRKSHFMEIIVSISMGNIRLAFITESTLPGKWSLITISQYNHSFHPMFLTDRSGVMEHPVVIVSPLPRSVHREVCYHERIALYSIVERSKFGYFIYFIDCLSPTGRTAIHPQVWPAR